MKFPRTIKVPEPLMPHRAHFRAHYCTVFAFHIMGGGRGAVGAVQRHMPRCTMPAAPAIGLPQSNFSMTRVGEV